MGGGGLVEGKWRWRCQGLWKNKVYFTCIVPEDDGKCEGWGGGGGGGS